MTSINPRCKTESILAQDIAYAQCMPNYTAMYTWDPILKISVCDMNRRDLFLRMSYFPTNLLFFHLAFSIAKRCEFYGMTWIYYFPSYVGVLVDIIYVSGDRKFNIIVMHVSLTLWKLDSLLFLVIS